MGTIKLTIEDVLNAKKKQEYNSDLNKAKYIIMGNRERLLFEHFNKYLRNDFIINYISESDGYDSYDAIITSGNSLMMCEIKVRDKNMEEYAEAGWFLEEQKIDKMIETDIKVDKYLYVNIFRNGVVIWDVTNKTKFNFSNLLLKANTADNPSNTKKEKSVAMLKNIEANIIVRYDFNLLNALKLAKRMYKKDNPLKPIPSEGLFNTRGDE